ncbi:MAG: DNA recombination protein RmuC [Dehalogenimonas sp.]
MTDILLILILTLLVISTIFLVILLAKTNKTGNGALAPRLEVFEKSLERTERAVREEATQNREEQNKAAREQRQELMEAFKSFGDSVIQRMTDVANVQKVQLDAFSGQLTTFAKASGERLDAVRTESATGAKQLREEVISTLNGISETMARTIKELAIAEKVQLEAFAGQINILTKTSNEKLDSIRNETAIGAKNLREEITSTLKGMTESNEKKLESVRITVEEKLQILQTDNAKQLEQMRQTVDEKLQGTLEKRLGESFKQVSERLEQVHKGLGEMQSLATGVGDLKKVLTNVKTRGTWGEVQLGSLLTQVLSPEQFAANVSTKDNNERVEYAIKLPGQSQDREETIWLPIDAKFPIEDYQRLVEAQENADVEGVEAAGKQLETRVKACAADICLKYINPPNTTDFGILFLPIEGLFAEVIRRTGLTEFVQRECRVVIAGPTTLWSILNSLQMGFRTLTIQKRSSEVWKLLEAVKTEWTKYGDVLEAVHKKLNQVTDTVETAKIRSRAIGRKLKDVHELPTAEATAILPMSLQEDSGDGDRTFD